MIRHLAWRAASSSGGAGAPDPKGYSRVRRWVLNPLYLIPVLFGLQAAVWYVGMPEDPSKLADFILSQASPRFSSEVAVIRYLCLFAALMVGVLVGQSALPDRKRLAGGPEAPSQSRVAALLWAARIAGLIALAAELFYVRHVLANPAMLTGAVQEGAFTDVGAAATSSRVVGLSSLNNVFIVTSTLCALVSAHPGVKAYHARSARRWLAATTVITLLHALVLSARMFFIYNLCAILGAYALVRPDALKGKTLLRLLLFAVLLVWTGETIRGGLKYAVRHDTGVLSAEVQRNVLDRLVMAYLASDYNNAMLILHERPSMQFVSTSLFIRVLPRPQVYHLPGAFGTVNTLALWWYDTGWFGLVVAFLAGFWMGLSYAAALRQAARLGPIVPFFMLTYPGVFACTRINFFGNTIFIASLAYLLTMTFVLHLLKRLGVEHRAAQAPAGAAGATGSVTG